MNDLKWSNGPLRYFIEFVHDVVKKFTFAISSDEFLVHTKLLSSTLFELLKVAICHLASSVLPHLFDTTVLISYPLKKLLGRL